MDGWLVFCLFVGWLVLFVCWLVDWLVGKIDIGFT
jgi:hypothetical protein